MSRALNGHNPVARREATALIRAILPSASDLSQAGAPVHAHSWQPVRGPHLRVVRRNYRKNRTGCVGISISRSDKSHSYFIVNLGQTNRKIRIETLGRHDAWRKALKLRADHELKIRAANAAILTARGVAAGVSPARRAA